MSDSIQNPAREMAKANHADEARSGELASLPDRLIAGVIDGAIVGFAISVLLTPIVMTGMVHYLLIPLVSSVIGFGVFAAVNFKFLQANGQTVGKSVMKLKIVKSDDSDVELKEVLVKRYGVIWAASAIPFVGILVALANVLLVLRDSRRAGHDEVAETKVVYC